MAKDIRLFWDRDLMECDCAFGSGDIATDDGFSTAIYLSLFTDRRARDDDKVDDPDDRGGWWGDQTSVDEIGSRLWLLRRAKTTQANLNLAKGYIQEALKWMIDDGVAQKISVAVERAGSSMDRLYYNILIQKSDGDIIAEKYDDVWNAQLSRDY